LSSRVAAQLDLVEVLVCVERDDAVMEDFLPA
jgi:hypothetical protein